MSRAATRANQEFADVRWYRGPALGAAVGLVGLQLAYATGYGFHRDELYFLAESRRLSWGYVSEPPFTPALAWLSRQLFGESLLGLRLWPALAGGLVVVLATLICRTLGGGRLAQLTTAVCVALSTVWLAIFHLFGTSAFDQLAWAGALLIVARLLAGADPRWWLGVGAVAGFGLLNKHTLVLLAVALPLGLLLGGRGTLLRGRWPWLGALLALLIISPNLAWQARNGWPLFDMSASISEAEGGPLGALLFVPMQLLTLNPFLAPVWLAGLVWLFRAPWFRPLAWTYLVALAVLMAAGGKFYYLAPMYLVLFAAGGIAVQRWLSARTRPRPATLLVALAAAGLVAAPVGLPILPATAHADVPVAAANPDLLETIGWPTHVARITAVRDGLPAEERADAIVLTRNYGQAGAVERFGAAFGLNKPVSGHNTYWLWGPPPDERATVIAVGSREGLGLDRAFRDVRPAGRLDNGIGVDNDEQGTPLWICRDPVAPWPQLWPTFRRYVA